MRISKVRVTNLGRCPRAERNQWNGRGLELLAEKQAAENKQHDGWVAILDMDTLLCAAHDLAERLAHDRKDPEQRWVMGRKAAILRRLGGMR